MDGCIPIAESHRNSAESDLKWLANGPPFFKTITNPQPNFGAKFDPQPIHPPASVKKVATASSPKLGGGNSSAWSRSIAISLSWDRWDWFGDDKWKTSPNPTREMRKEEQGSSNQSSAIPELAINHFIHHVFVYSTWNDVLNGLMGKSIWKLLAPFTSKFPSFPSGKLVSLDLHQD